MSYVSQRPQFSFRTLSDTVADYWQRWRAACDRNVTEHYNQRIEANPEWEAQQYWERLKLPQSGINIYQISDAMLSRLMQQMSDQGISKFAVDRFILELRRQTRSVQ